MINKLSNALSHFTYEKTRLETRIKLLNDTTLKAQKVLVGDLLSFVNSIIFDIKTTEKKDLKAVAEKYEKKDDEFLKLCIECQNSNWHFQAEFYREIGKYSGRARLEFKDVC